MENFSFIKNVENILTSGSGFVIVVEKGEEFNMLKSMKVRNVLAVSTLAAMIAMPGAVNAANYTGNYNTAIAISEASNLTGNVVVGDDAGTALDVTVGSNTNNKAYTIDLGGHTVTLKDGTFKVTAAEKITIKNGNIVCENAAGDCLAADHEVELVNVNVTSKKGNGVQTDDVATITGGSIVAKTSTMKTIAPTSGKTVKVSGTTFEGDTAATDLEISGTVTGPSSIITAAQDGATVIVNDVNASGDNFTSGGLSGTDKATVDYSKFDFTKKNAAGTAYVVTKASYTVQYDKAHYNVVLPAIFEQTALSGDNVTMSIKGDNLDALNAAKNAYAAKDADAKKAMNDKYGAAIVTAAFGVNFANDDIRDQAAIDAHVTRLNNMLAMNELTKDDQQAIEELPKPTETTKPDGTANGNPQTGDNIATFVGLALTSVAGLGLAIKKFLR